MRVSEAFPSKYLQSADLQGRTIPVVISHIQVEEVGQNPSEHKPVVYFRGASKGLVLNITNANTIAQAFGDEMDNWPGQSVEVFVIQTEYKGKPVHGLRVRPKNNDTPPPVNDPAQQAPPPLPPAPAPTATAADDLDDEIPF